MPPTYIDFPSGKLLGRTYLWENTKIILFFILFLFILSLRFTLILSRVYMSSYINLNSCRRYKEIQYKYNKNNFWSCTTFNTTKFEPMHNKSKETYQTHCSPSLFGFPSVPHSSSTFQMIPPLTPIYGVILKYYV